MAALNSLFRPLRSQRGAELIEFALVFPLLLLVLLGVVDFGLLFQRYEVLTNATREGARVAILPGYTEADVKGRVCQYLIAGGVPTTGCPGVTPTNPAVTMVEWDIPITGKPAVKGRKVTVAYNHNFMFVGPIISLMGGSWTNAKTITTVAIMRKEIAGP
ncbi:MAG: TadE/TadG family type IV pilus assembly protein [Vicinamibacterales bacterium]